MPKITDMQIQKNNKTRANVYLDGEFAFALEMVTVMKLGLKIGAEVSTQKLQEAVFDSEKSVAFGKAVDYLGRGSKTTAQMKKYLSGKGFEAEIVGYVVDKLEDYRYLDDQTYAKNYAEQNSANKGTRRIKQELLQRGIDAETAEVFSEQDGELCRQNAQKLAEKYMKNKPCDLKTVQKLQRYLLSRGYDFDAVNAAIAPYKCKINGGGGDYED